MRNKIFGGIGILWGGGIIGRWLFVGLPVHAGGSLAYQAGAEVGQKAALVFGAAMLVAGIYYLFFKEPD